MKPLLQSLLTKIPKPRKPRPRPQTVVDVIFTGGLSAVAVGFGMLALWLGLVVGGALAVAWALQAGRQLPPEEDA